MSSTSIQLIVGLGNPGEKYSRTRHNAGFWFVDTIADKAHETFRAESRFSGAVTKTVIAGKPVWLLKPMTFMNRSGLPVKQISSFYKIPVEQILVAHDELDLMPGVCRLKEGGGHGGHNGLRDIHAHLGNAYKRLRIGVGHPGDRHKVVDYVLSNPGKQEDIEIHNSIDRALEVLELAVSGEMQKAMHQLHSQ